MGLVMFFKLTDNREKFFDSYFRFLQLKKMHTRDFSKFFQSRISYITFFLSQVVKKTQI